MKGFFAVLLGVLFVLALTAVAVAQDDTAALKAEMKKLQDRIDKLEAAKGTTPTVESKTGTIKVGALLQQWYVSTDQESEYEGDRSGRSLAYSSYYNNTFKTRRARLNLAGFLSEQLSWFTQFDFACNDDESKLYDEALLDLWLNYKFDEANSLTVGQFEIPFGYETLVPSSDLETVERALVYSQAFVGNYWDVGLQYTGTFPSTEVKVALVQGEGQAKLDADDRLDACARVNFKPQTIPGLEVGGSIYAGKDSALDENRSYYGGHVVYTADQLKLMAEYVKGNTMEIEEDTVGWYGLASYMFRSDFGAAFRYEELDPDDDTSGDTIQSWTLGLNYYLLKNNAKIQADYVHYDPASGDAINDVIINFQIKI